MSATPGWLLLEIGIFPHSVIGGVRDPLQLGNLLQQGFFDTLLQRDIHHPAALTTATTTNTPGE